MTGLHTGHSPVRGNDEWKERGDVWSFEAMFEDSKLEGQRPLPDSTFTVASFLQSQGYKTGMVGKWHLGQGSDYHPMSRGFDSYFGVLAGASQFFETLPEGAAFARSDAPGPRSSYNAVYRGREPVQVDEYLTDVFTKEALDFIDKNASDPFFLYLSHTTRTRHYRQLKNT